MKRWRRRRELVSVTRIHQAWCERVCRRLCYQRERFRAKRGLDRHCNRTRTGKWILIATGNRPDSVLEFFPTTPQSASCFNPALSAGPPGNVLMNSYMLSGLAACVKTPLHLKKFDFGPLRLGSRPTDKKYPGVAGSELFVRQCCAQAQRRSTISALVHL